MGRNRRRHGTPHGGGFPLSMAIPGDVVRLVGVRGGNTIRRRLADMGLTPGMIVRVVQTNGGPVIIAFRDDSRLALGWGMAQKIYVEPVL